MIDDIWSELTSSITAPKTPVEVFQAPSDNRHCTDHFTDCCWNVRGGRIQDVAHPWENCWFSNDSSHRRAGCSVFFASGPVISATDAEVITENVAAAKCSNRDVFHFWCWCRWRDPLLVVVRLPVDYRSWLNLLEINPSFCRHKKSQNIYGNQQR